MIVVLFVAFVAFCSKYWFVFYSHKKSQKVSLHIEHPDAPIGARLRVRMGK
jgi:hypothetical protein